MLQEVMKPSLLIMDSKSGHPKLIRTNYHSWKLNAKVQLTRLGALGIVEGTEPVPEFPFTTRAAEVTNYSQNVKVYRQAREKAIQWIWNHIHSDFHSIVAVVRRDPRAMWLELERRLGGRNNHNIWAVRQQLGSETFKENDTIQTWSARLDTYSQRLIGTGSELSDLERIAKLLSTLPKRFEITVSHIQRIPNLDYQTALQQLLDFENQLPEEAIDINPLSHTIGGNATTPLDKEYTATIVDEKVIPNQSAGSFSDVKKKIDKTKNDYPEYHAVQTTQLKTCRLHQQTRPNRHLDLIRTTWKMDLPTWQATLHHPQTNGYSILEQAIQ
ncbi:hypothetical protein N7532_000027 [Penicillium argentinense]|uniref:Retrotransposon Copia-like N-terminal domain-containing protein n=1 Tax=Penicillium argentinense TaxID=1131581 RepID=A0A9W9G612_9EURO|nr:uncharacterized protein N7532_000027 [Penicillium argentinense]KAJ5111982.1 hypothetical protein N7532_000027 [Penicillium argentinense]